MTIKNYVDVNITQTSALIARLGFNVPVFLFESDTLDRTKIISTSDYEDADLGGTTSELYKAVATYLSQPLIAQTIVVGCKKTTDATWADAISAIRDENDNWYGVVSVTRVKADILAISAVVELIEPGRMHFAITSDASVLAKEADGSGDANVATQLSNLGYYKTNLIYSSYTDGYANAGLSAYLSYDPGSITYNYKEIVGVTTETITAQERQNLIDQNTQVQKNVASLKSTYDSGMVCSGEWIDIMVGIDWLTARISEGVFSILVTSPKLPFTNGGLQILGTEIIRNLTVASDSPFNFITEDFIVFIPDVKSFSSAEKASRSVTGLTFTANAQGAIHLVQIRGKLVV